MSALDTSRGIRIYKIGAYPNFYSNNTTPTTNPNNNNNNSNNLANLTDDAELYDTSIENKGKQPNEEEELIAADSSSDNGNQKKKKNNNERNKSAKKNSNKDKRKQPSSSPSSSPQPSNKNINSDNSSTNNNNNNNMSNPQTREKVEVFEVNRKKETPRTKSGRVFAIRGTTKTIIEVTTTEVVEENPYKVEPPPSSTRISGRDSIKPTKNDEKDKLLNDGETPVEEAKKDENNSDNDENGKNTNSDNSGGETTDEYVTDQGGVIAATNNGDDSDSSDKKSKKSKSKKSKSDSDTDTDYLNGRTNNAELLSTRNKKKPKSNDPTATESETETTNISRLGKNKKKTGFKAESLPFIEKPRDTSNNKSKSRTRTTSKSDDENNNRLPFILNERQKPHVHSSTLRGGDQNNRQANLPIYDPGYKRCPCLMHNRLYYMDERPIDQEERHYQTNREFWHDHTDHDLVYGRRFISNYPARPTLKDFDLLNDTLRKTPWNPHGF